MKHRVALSVAAGLMLAAGLAQAKQILVAGEFERENVIVESAGMSGAGGGSPYHPDWVENYPFPAQFGPVD